MVYLEYCLRRPVETSLMMGGIFTAINVAQGMPLSPRMVAINCGGLYLYNILQCPMAMIHGRESALHNGASAATLGYIGVQRGHLGVPFMDPYFFYRNPRISPPVVGAAVYGGMGMFFGILGNKPI